MIDIVVGGQYGSEGKGKVTQYFMNSRKASAVVKCGGPNSGHTIYVNGKKYVLRQLPVSALYKDIVSVIPAGAYIDLEILLEEIKITGVSPRNVWIDKNAYLISKKDKDFEASSLVGNIGSTGSGVGQASANRILRKDVFSLAGSSAQLKPFIQDVKTHLNFMLDAGRTVIIEGTQGYGLSLFHSENYPWVTGRDTTASGFLSEVGLSPLLVRDIILTIRLNPIRVAGNSGPLENEISWAEVSNRAGKEVCEKTSATHKTRRVADFSPEIVIEAMKANRPTITVLNHTDYVKTGDRYEIIRRVESEIRGVVDFIGSNPFTLHPWGNITGGGK